MPFAKLRSRLLSLHLQEDLAEGIRTLYDTFLRVGMNLQKFESLAFTRLKQLRALTSAGELAADLRWIRGCAPA